MQQYPSHDDASLDSDSSRLETEIELLTAAYGEDLSFAHRARELRFTTHSATQSSSNAPTTHPATHPQTTNHTLHLRIPPDYPSTTLPLILSASGPHNTDLRTAMTATLQTLSPGEEVLDLLISNFVDLVAAATTSTSTTTLPNNTNSNGSNATYSYDKTTEETASAPAKPKTLTVLIWTHHLLALSKRKLALSPPASSPPVRGITKPGYPGVMVFSGPREAVREHVEGLKAQNWAAFQVRLEVEEDAEPEHEKGGGSGRQGKRGEGGEGRGGGWFEGEEKWEGVKEVETMGEVVKGIGEGRKGVFLEAMRMK